MLSDVAVRRPVFAAVAAIVLCVIGAAAFFFLPVRELPDVDPPIVSVSTSYAGASAEVIENQITEPIEQQVAGIQGIERINSTSRDGRSNVSIEFALGRDIDVAASDVRDRVSRVQGNLPDQAQPPEVAKADSDGQPIMILFLRSSTMNRLELTDYADRYLLDRLATVPGVAQVQIYGEQRYAMRIWLDPDAMAARGLTVTQVEQALTRQNVELPAGALESTDKNYTIRVDRTYARAEDFAQLPITATGNASSQSAGASGAVSTGAQPTGSGAQGALQGRPVYVTRLGDIARVEEAPEETRRLFRGNGLDQIGLAVTRQAQANDLEISKGVSSLVEQIRGSLPPETELVVGSDNSVFTKHAIEEVWITIGISMVLVALVNFIFLGTLRAAIIPSIVAPICLLATFIVLAPLGFSLNLLTLLALVLAIGLVVDDAIVVTENIQRRLDHGEPPLVAAERGTRQVFFAVVATTIVLLSVFAPLMFLPGYVGRLFVELAAAIAAAIAFSAFLALTLSPMLASKILRPASGGGWVARRVDFAMDKLKNSYANSLDMLVGRRGAVFGVSAVVLLVAGGAALMFLKLPNELVPPEDRGRVTVRVQGPEGAGFDYTRDIMLGLEPILAEYREAGEVESFLVSAPGFGGGSFNSGNAVMVLKDWSERDRPADEIAQELNGKLRGQVDAQVNASTPGAFQRGGGGGGNSVEVVVTGSDYSQIFQWLQPILAAAQDNPGFSRPRLNYEPNSPRLLVQVDPQRAAALGVSSQEIGRTLETMFGSRRATTYLRGGQEYDVILQTDREDRSSLSNLNTLYVGTGNGVLVPLSSVVSTETSGATPDRRRLDRQRAITLSADLNPGMTIADAVAFMDEQVAQQPQGVVNVQYGGAARDQQEAGGAVAAAFGLALLLVFLVLAAQFESWITPAVIMLTVPLAAAGGLFGLLMAGSSLNIYSQIGLIILIGVAAKNGILIVEFANQLRDQGRSIKEAIVESSALRLRPIIMTSIATAFGALPLMLWQGAGAGSRQTIGVVIFTGAMFATLLTLFVVPVIYGALARFTRSPEYTARKIEEWEAQEQTANDAVPIAAE
ncbi:multidrug transporter AcrB [Brevundimonas sp. AAP58]|uniref:efflux RND transporter permease subunit n=1 Tax=Brevundimonas sp. AAP58 TaxID=1523422 RepID=UPI0006B994F7|nr:efflux RND transporter permease subunit [Brevundimonas sp. AAP58]KPF81100.1 multidrug transporter AcrB [Brevundimonas sp. AAP58]